MGITRHLTATGAFSDGSLSDVSASATWAVQAAGMASVNNGVASGLALGATGVTATLGSVSASASVAVTTNTGSAAPQMPTERVAGHTATLLPGGRLRVVGGAKSAGTAAADLFDPASATWTTVASAAAKGYVNHPSAEIHDPVAATRTPRGSTAATHTSAGAVLLPDGRLLVAGGTQFALPAAELSDPATGAWTAAASRRGIRSSPTFTRLPDGSVMVCGGALDASGVDCETFWRGPARREAASLRGLKARGSPSRWG